MRWSGVSRARTPAAGAGASTIDEGEEPPPTPQMAQVRQPYQRERAEVGMSARGWWGRADERTDDLFIVGIFG
jgi:hypothetical protein